MLETGDGVDEKDPTEIGVIEGVEGALKTPPSGETTSARDNVGGLGELGDEKETT